MDRRTRKMVDCLICHCKILIKIAEGSPDSYWWDFGDNLRRPIDPFFPEMQTCAREDLWQKQWQEFAEVRKSLATAVTRFRDEVLIPCSEKIPEGFLFLHTPQFESIQHCLEHYMRRAMQEGALMEARQAFNFDAQLFEMVDGCLFDPSIRKPEGCR